MIRSGAAPDWNCRSFRPARDSPLQGQVTRYCLPSPVLPAGPALRWQTPHPGTTGSGRSSRLPHRSTATRRRRAEVVEVVHLFAVRQAEALLGIQVLRLHLEHLDHLNGALQIFVLRNGFVRPGPAGEKSCIKRSRTLMRGRVGSSITIGRSFFLFVSADQYTVLGRASQRNICEFFAGTRKTDGV